MLEFTHLISLLITQILSSEQPIKLNLKCLQTKRIAPRLGLKIEKQDLKSLRMSTIYATSSFSKTEVTVVLKAHNHHNKENEESNQELNRIKILKIFKSIW